MKKNILKFLLLVSFWGIKAQELPGSAVPGKCYIKCITADEFKKVTKTIVTSPSYKELKTYPATYKTITEKVLVKEASEKLVPIAAEYETVSVPYASKEESSSLSVVPARFGSESKTIETNPKIGKWEYKVLDNCPSANKADCMVACFVEYPAKTTTVNMKTLVSDATTKQVSIPGKQDVYAKRVVKKEARVEKVAIPAEYSTIKKVVVDSPARAEEVVIAEKTTTITLNELVKKGGMTVWEEVDCSIASGANVLPILYETNSARLTTRSLSIIDNNLLKLMNDKPNLRIEISSHTDSRGNDEYNETLSQQRAQSVVNYLAEKGVSRNRLEAKGYGENRLKNKCNNGVDCTSAQHQVNRRTEFRIIQ